MTRLSTRLQITHVLPLLVLAAGCSAIPDGDIGDAPGTVSQAAISQATTNSFYDMNNTITVRITMDAAQWSALLAEEPVGGRCNFENSPSVDRFQWRATTNVQVSGTSFPASAKTYTGVEIKKKSFCGSFSNTKPAIKLKFGGAAETDLGTRHLTLNNSVQDPSYVRQALGYRLFRAAGLPASRINFARVYVNNVLVDDGVFVNVEPIRESFIQNPANNFASTAGNLYEFEKDDFTSERIPYIDVEGVSRYSDKKDLTVAAQQIALGPSGAYKVINMQEWIRVHAMEALLKHWDGFSDNNNNTYAYNDVTAVASPSADAGNVRFKLIPWGLDQILQPGSPFQIDDDPTIAALINTHQPYYNELMQDIAEYRETVFSRSQMTQHMAFIDLMQSKLSALGVTRNAEIDEVRRQLRLVRSPAIYWSGISHGVDNLYLIMRDTSEALYASNSEHVGSSTTDFELIHQPLADTRAQRWFLIPGLTGTLFKNEKYPDHPWMHASGTQRTPANNLYLYSTPNDDTVKAKEFYIRYSELSADHRQMSGYFRLQSVRTGQWVQYSTGADNTPTGRPRVHQAAEASATEVHWY